MSDKRKLKELEKRVEELEKKPTTIIVNPPVNPLYIIVTPPQLPQPRWYYQPYQPRPWISDGGYTGGYAPAYSNTTFVEKGTYIGSPVY